MFPFAACHGISPRPHSIVKAVLRSPKSQQVASRCAGTLKKVCKAVVAKKGAHSGF